MADMSIDEARAAQCAAPWRLPRDGKDENESSKSPNTTATAHVASVPLTISTNPTAPLLTSVIIKRLHIYPASSAIPPATTATTLQPHHNSGELRVLLVAEDIIETHPPLELEASPVVSVNREECADSLVEVFRFVASPLAHPAGRIFSPNFRITLLFSIPGSPTKSPQSVLTSKVQGHAPQVKGLDDSCIDAIRIGTVDPHLDDRYTISFHDVYFVPGSTTRFISVLSLGRGGKCSTHFCSDCCCVLDSSSIVAFGAVSPNCQL